MRYGVFWKQSVNMSHRLALRNWPAAAMNKRGLSSVSEPFTVYEKSKGGRKKNRQKGGELRKKETLFFVGLESINRYSGYYFERPGLDRLRDAARDGLIDVVLVHDPDRLARRYAYQVLLIEELQRWAVQVRFIEQPPADSPDQKLLVQIQGAIAEYERARILERTRRGRLFWARQGRPVSSVSLPGPVSLYRLLLYRLRRSHDRYSS